MHIAQSEVDGEEMIRESFVIQTPLNRHTVLVVKSLISDHPCITSVTRQPPVVPKWRHMYVI